MGPRITNSFIRFYMAVGLAHGGSNFSPTWDNLTTLDNWVDKGVPPPAVSIVYGNGKNTTGRTMPLCMFPTWPEFVGGDCRVERRFFSSIQMRHGHRSISFHSARAG